MKNRLFGLGLSILGSFMTMTPAWAEDLFLAYPPAEHQTTSARIFLIGTGDPDRPVLVNGEPIEDRSVSGHFAPTVPLAMGENVLVLTQGDTSLTVRVTRVAATLTLPEGSNFLPDSLLPQVDMTRQVGDVVCFGAVATPNARVSVNWGNEAIALAPQPNVLELPPNSAVFTAQNEPVPLTGASTTVHKGCTVVPSTGELGSPQYTINLDGQTVTQAAPGAIDRVAQPLQVAEVVVESGVARTGPSTNYSRITPLPKGTRAIVTGTEGDWLRLDYGGWIRASETQVTTATAPPRTIIRSVTSQQTSGWTEIRFPLQVPVPVSVEQTADTFTLTLHNTTPQTDTIFLNADAAIERLDWTPILPDKAQYRFQLRTNQQWGYKLRYEGTTLVLSLRHPPQQLTNRPLSGMTILVDPGHGGEELGARGPNGYPEKDMNLVVSKLLRTALEARGATVVMTREEDETVSLRDRVEAIASVEPTLALSIHYNALPDAGDALNTAGIGMFWYNAQAHSLAQFLHDRLVMTLDRPSDGVYWNNLALTRPTVAPSILLELGFAINPYEFEWITDPDARVALAEEIANAIELWCGKSRGSTHD